MHGLVTDRFAAQHGRIKGQETAILAMGRLGSREMTASSDLDLILLYDFEETARIPTANDRCMARIISRASPSG